MRPDRAGDRRRHRRRPAEGDAVGLSAAHARARGRGRTHDSGRRLRAGVARRRGRRRGARAAGGVGGMTTAISASLVKELRDQTGAPIMDAKRALQDANGDIEVAKRLLRERGMASAAKRAGRQTTEGVVLLKTGDGRGSLVAIGCETEPVSKNEEFRAFAEHVLEAAYSTYLAEKVDDLDVERNDLIAKIGENIVIVGTVTFEAVDGAVIEGYVHPPANKLGVLVQLRRGSPDSARKLAMHIAASAPQWVGGHHV